MNTSINTETGVIKSGSLGKFFRSAPWREATQEEIETSPFPLQEAKDSKIAQCKATASSLIAASYPLHTQLNHLAEVAVIQDKQIAGDAIPQEDLDSLQSARDAKDFINAIRVQSQGFEAAILAVTTNAKDVNNIPINFI